MLIEFDDVGRGDDFVFVEENVLRFSGEGAKGLRENNDWVRESA